MTHTSIAVAVALALVGLSGCQCGEADLIRTYEDPRLDDAGTPVRDAGGGAVVVVTAPKDAGTTTQIPMGPGWCASDCDCAADQRCIATGGELSENLCQSGFGNGTCTQMCSGGCPTGQQCVNGSCQMPPCVGANCPSNYPISVQGTYFTFYELDVHDFANSAGHILKLLDLLVAALSGTGASCSSQNTPEAKLMCYVVNLIGQNIHAPQWVTQLIQVMSDAFRFGDKPVRIKGKMQLAEGANGTLFASETWSEMWLDYNGQSLNVMQSPVLGQAGNVKVTVAAFRGTRTASEVMLGPRSVDFDVNKLIVNMLGVVISAASNGKAHDVGGLIDLILCDNFGSATGALCRAAADEFAKKFQLESGLGGTDISAQKATIHDLDGNNIADALGLPNARGSVTGEMSNGFVDGALGSFPASSWYGTK